MGVGALPPLFLRLFFTGCRVFLNQQARRHAVSIATAMPPARLFHNQMRKHEKTAISAIRQLKGCVRESCHWCKKGDSSIKANGETTDRTHAACNDYCDYHNHTVQICSDLWLLLYYGPMQHISARRSFDLYIKITNFFSFQDNRHQCRALMWCCKAEWWCLMFSPCPHCAGLPERHPVPAPLVCKRLTSHHTGLWCSC